MILLRSLAYNLAFYINVTVLMILGLPCMFAGRRGVIFMARLWASISVWLLERICGLRVEYRGVENIPTGGYIIAAKHQSYLETFAMLKYSPDFAIVLKKQLLWLPLFGLYLAVSRQIAIDRARGRNALAQIIAQAGPVLRSGRQVYIYPEGTRRAPGASPNYKGGVAALYAETGAPCLPVALNTGLFWGRRGFRRRPGVAVIQYLPPIPPGLDHETFATRLREAIETACARLNEEALKRDPSLGPIVGEAPGATPTRLSRAAR
jgi:1-acyl-sn-glycerol-3-phosphate acyltransferase